MVAEALGTPLMPWQRYVADVAGERLPDGSYAYRVVVVSVPRQSGKTTLIRAVGTFRAGLLGRDVFYTAQTGKDARARFRDLQEAVRLSPFRSRVKFRMSAGSEAMEFPNGRAFRVFAPTPDSLHGYTPPTVCCDEAFAHSEEDGDLLMGAIGPAQVTLVDRQIWIVSTAGTAESTWLRKWLRLALAGTDRVAVFHWAAEEADDPNDPCPCGRGHTRTLDLYDPADVAAFHPAVGFLQNGKVLQASEVIDQAQTTGSAAEYARAYGNRESRAARVIVAADAWEALAAADQAAPVDPSGVVLSYDVAGDGMASTILATWRDPTGKPTTRVYLAGPGVAWVEDEVAAAVEAWPGVTVAADDGGHTRDVTARLQARGVEVAVLSARDFASATSRLLAGIRDHGFSHDGSRFLATQVSGVALRPSSDGTVISRRHSAGDVSGVVSLAAALWVIDGTPPDVHGIPLAEFAGAL